MGCVPSSASVPHGERRNSVPGPLPPWTGSAPHGDDVAVVRPDASGAGGSSGAAPEAERKGPPAEVPVPAGEPAPLHGSSKNQEGDGSRQLAPAAAAGPGGAGGPGRTVSQRSSIVSVDEAGVLRKRRRLRVHVCGTPDDVQRLEQVLSDLRDDYAFDVCGDGGGPCGEPAGGECPCRAFVFVTSRASAADARCLAALNDAIDGGRDVCPLFVDDPSDAVSAFPLGLDMRLRQFQWTWPLGAADEPGYDTRLEALAEALQRIGRRERALGSWTEAKRKIGWERSAVSRETAAPNWARGELPADAPSVRVFVSYAHANAAVVRPIKEALEERGFSCWFDEMQLAAGMRWVDEVARAVRNCTHLLFFASAKSVVSQYCGEEFCYAYDEKKAIVVAWVEGHEAVVPLASEALAMRLRRFPAADVHGAGAEQSAEAIAQRIADPQTDARLAESAARAHDSVALSHDASAGGDPLLAALAKYARAELEKDDLTAGLALYVPPTATDPGPLRREALDLDSEATRFLRQFATPPAPAEDGAGAELARAARHRALLLLGDAGTSKSTFLRFAHRRACQQWVRGGASDPAARLPATVLVPLPELADAPGGVHKAVRQAVAARLSLAPESLVDVRRRAGLVLLLDGYDETGETANLWDSNGIGDFASAVVISCRTEYLASLPTKRPERTFAPVEGGQFEVAKLRQLATRPFNRSQVEEYLGKYALQHARDGSGWTFDRYAAELQRTPGLASLAENPFTLSMLARVLPQRAAEASLGGEGRALGPRALYPAFVEDWLRRELWRGNRLKGAAAWAGDEEGLVEAGVDLCRRLAVLLFRMGTSQVSVAAGKAKQNKRAPGSAEQRACERLLEDGESLFVRNSCPLRRWRQGEALGFAFVHKTLLEFLAAEAVLSAVTGAEGPPEGRDPCERVDLATRPLAGEATLVRFLADAAQNEPESGLAPALFALVEASRAGGPVEGSPEALAASNAATVLVAAHVSMAGRDLSGARLAGANLWRLEAAGADLRRADLRGCALQEACLSGADLRGARLDGCRTNARPALDAPGASASGVALSADGKRIVAAGADHAVWMWDGDTGTRIAEMSGHALPVTAVAFSADGRRIATGSRDHSVRLWDGETGAEVGRLAGHTDAVASVALSADGRRAASAGEDGTVRVWDAEAGTELMRMAKHSTAVKHVAISADGVRVLFASDEKALRLWDVGRRAERLRLQLKEHAVTSVALSPDGTRIAAGCRDKMTRVYDAESGGPLLDVQGHTAPVASLLFSADGKRLVTGSADKSVLVFDVQSGAELQQLVGHTTFVTAVAASADLKRVVSSGVDGSVRVWDLDLVGDLQQLAGHTGFVTAVAVSADRTRIASSASDGSVRVWDARSGAELLQLRGHAARIQAVAVCADGSRIASGSSDRTVRLWSCAKGAEERELRGHRAQVTSVALSSDGRWVASGSKDRSVIVWDAEKGVPHAQFRGHKEIVTSVACTASCHRVVSGSYDSSVRVWSLDRGEEVLAVRGKLGQVTSVGTSEDGGRLVAGDRDGLVWVLSGDSGAILHCLRGHTDRVMSVAISADGSRIVSGSWEKSVRVWGGDGAPLACIAGHTHVVRSVAVQASGPAGVVVVGTGLAVRLYAAADFLCTRRFQRTSQLEARGAKVDEATSLSPHLRRLLAQLGAGDPGAQRLPSVASADPAEPLPPALSMRSLGPLLREPESPHGEEGD